MNGDRVRGDRDEWCVVYCECGKYGTIGGMDVYHQWVQWCSG